jgi:glycine dehydrogenase subunit 1
MPYTPHTEDDIQSMLKAIGVKSIDTLFDEIPVNLRCKDIQLPEGQNEMMMLKTAEHLAAKNKNGLCFLGAGSYEHHIPAAVWDVTSRGEFLTAYTPYQAEASQGTLQLLYEFQTMISELTGMDVANASMYDGASALAEAILMSARIQKHHVKQRILIPQSLHPLYRDTVQTILNTLNIEIIECPYDKKLGTIDLSCLQAYEKESITALVIAHPNFFGCLEEVDTLTNWAHQHQMLVIGCVNPTSLGLLKPPGQWGEKGADIVCGEGQPLGVPMASGGPYFGFLSSRLSHVRQMPGRIIGRTVDKDGKPGFTLTLQAREQHIRREKATSNICTNQGLLVTAATLYMSLVGSQGIHEVALACHQNTCALTEALTQIPGVTIQFTSPFFHEVVIHLPIESKQALVCLQQMGILGGYALKADYPELGECILVCATEMRTQEDIQRYSHALSHVLTQDAKDTDGSETSDHLSRAPLPPDGHLLPESGEKEMRKKFIKGSEACSLST